MLIKSHPGESIRGKSLEAIENNKFQAFVIFKLILFYSSLFVKCFILSVLPFNFVIS